MDTPFGKGASANQEAEKFAAMLREKRDEASDAGESRAEVAVYEAALILLRFLASQWDNH